MKRKVLNVTYRKDSRTFDDWMKYEIEILNEDGSIEKIPAYGKDLQDALSRVVHDAKVEKIEKREKRGREESFGFGATTFTSFRKIIPHHPATGSNVGFSSCRTTRCVASLSCPRCPAPSLPPGSRRPNRGRISNQ